MKARIIDASSSINNDIFTIVGKLELFDDTRTPEVILESFNISEKKNINKTNWDTDLINALTLKLQSFINDYNSKVNGIGIKYPVIKTKGYKGFIDNIFNTVTTNLVVT